jgi:hypothetical protein
MHTELFLKFPRKKEKMLVGSFNLKSYMMNETYERFQ